MTELTGKNGAKIVIRPASWQHAKYLKMAIERELGGLDVLALASDPVSAQVAYIMKLDSSETVDRALWPCLVQCTYNLEKITEATFDDVKAREDYYDIVGECMKVNLGPLFESLTSKLSELGILKKREVGSPK